MSVASVSPPILRIVTDASDTCWLAYLLQEFCRIQDAQFACELIPLDECAAENASTLYYTEQVHSGVWIPNRSGTPLTGTIEWLTDDLFVLTGTTAETEGHTDAYDLLWNAFVFLSRMEEYLCERGGSALHSYGLKHPRQDKSTFDIPVVNRLFAVLESLILQDFPYLRFGPGTETVIEFSHDVDYIAKTPQLRIKETVMNCVSVLRSLTDTESLLRHARRTVGFLCSHPSYWCFDYWREIEKRHGVRSVFYVYARVGSNSLRSWLLDPSYAIGNNDELRHTLRQLAKDGFEIGLHGSVRSATDETRLTQEKKCLQDALDLEVKKVRQHWLEYRETITPHLHNRLFQSDSTLGWNDRIGFRSGCSSGYRPYDHVNRRAFDYCVIPQVVMDANLFHYNAKNVAPLQRKAIEMLSALRQQKSTHVAVSWHQRVCNADYRWHEPYEEILKRFAGPDRTSTSTQKGDEEA